MPSVRTRKRIRRRSAALFPLFVTTSPEGDVELSLPGRKPLRVKAAEVPLIRAALALPRPHAPCKAAAVCEAEDAHVLPDGALWLPSRREPCALRIATARALADDEIDSTP